MIDSFIENVLNRGLPRSPRAQQLCRELQGRRIAVQASGFARLIIESTGVTLALRRSADESADAQIHGGIVSLGALAGPDPKAVLQRGEVRIDGDAELAERFRELAMLLRPDLEEELSGVIGDVPAHQLGRMARGALGFARRVARTGARNTAEYLAHERGDLVPRDEGEQFLKGVDALREDVDRLEARLAQLLARGEL